MVSITDDQRVSRRIKRRKKKGEESLFVHEASSVLYADKLKTWSISPLCLLAWILPGTTQVSTHTYQTDAVAISYYSCWRLFTRHARACFRWNSRRYRTGIRTNRRIGDRFPMSGVTPVERRPAGFFLYRFKVLEYRNWKGINNSYRSRELIIERRKHI